MRKQKSGAFADLTGGYMELNADGFRCAGQVYAYDQVTDTRLYARRISLYFLPIGEHVRLEVSIEGRDKPIVIENSGVLGTGAHIRRTYAQLSERTASRRIRR